MCSELGAESPVANIGTVYEEFNSALVGQFDEGRSGSAVIMQGEERGKHTNDINTAKPDEMTGLTYVINNEQ
jgi:hypothetical protein